jgi:hypothetical protein
MINYEVAMPIISRLTQTAGTILSISFLPTQINGNQAQHLFDSLKLLEILIPKALILHRDMSEEMNVDPARAQSLISQIGAVKNRIASVASGRNACISQTL